MPVFRPKYLLLSLGMFMQIILGSYSGESILQSHYASVFLTALSLATIFSLKYLFAKPKFLKFYQKNKTLLILILLTGLIYNFFVLGPLIPGIKTILTTDYQQVALKKEFIKQIPKDAAIITTYDLIANLSSRPKIYSLSYTFLNQQQYGAGEYKIPADTQYLLINFNDFISYKFQYENRYPDNYTQGAKTLRNLIRTNNYQLKKAKQNLALWQKNSSTDLQLYRVHSQLPKITNPQNQSINQQLEFLGFNYSDNLVSLYFKPLTQISQNYFIEINQQIYPLGYGLYPATEWQPEQIIELNFYGLAFNQFQIINIQGGVEKNDFCSITNVFDQIDILAKVDLFGAKN